MRVEVNDTGYVMRRYMIGPPYASIMDLDVLNGCKVCVTHTSQCACYI